MSGPGAFGSAQVKGPRLALSLSKGPGRPKPARLGGGFRGDDHGAGAVVDARGVAGRHRAALAKSRRQLGEDLHGGVAARVLVLGDDRLALAGLDADLDDLLVEEAAILRRL